MKHVPRSKTGKIVGVLAVWSLLLGSLTVSFAQVPRPGPSGPLRNAPPPTYVGPTVNLTKVANAIGVSTKSLTILVTAAPGLALTQPVQISIAYLSPMGGSERLTQNYVASTGNRFLRNDPEGNGTPRRVELDITLSEPKPGGGAYTFLVRSFADLDPLYDVSISPLQLSPIDSCASVGDAEFIVRYSSPAGQGQDIFTTTAGKIHMIPGFAWGRGEVSASMNLQVPWFWFYISQFDIPGLPRFIRGVATTPPFVNLVPGKSQTVKGNAAALTDDYCRVYFEYTTTYTLRSYFGLPTVRDHR